jgi:hypothetical protein
MACGNIELLHVYHILRGTEPWGQLIIHAGCTEKWHHCGGRGQTSQWIQQRNFRLQDGGQRLDSCDTCGGSGWLAGWLHMTTVRGATKYGVVAYLL